MPTKARGAGGCKDLDHRPNDPWPKSSLRRLAEVGWLAQEPPDFQARIAAAGRWVRYPRGALLYAENEEGRAVFGLGEGPLDVEAPISPNEVVVVHRASPGFWIGESAVLAGASRTLALRAATDCTVFQVPAAAVQRMLKERPADWASFCRLSHQNATLAVRSVAELIALPTKARFARLLLRLAAEDGSVRATQDELGALAGMSRASFRRALGELIEAGVIVTSYRGVRIADMAALRAVARLV